MPQFDSSSFLSQIFWLAICFATLYFAMKKVYLPRITEILAQRRKNIEHDSLISQELYKKTQEINETSKASIDQSSHQYQMAMDQAAKEANLRREQALNDLRKKTEVMSNNSQKQIADFIENSKNNSADIIKNLVNVLSKKMLAEHSKKDFSSTKNLNE